MNGKVLISTYLFLLLSLSPIDLSSQETFRVMFYNVENLYDTINNPKTLDDDFTPDGKLHWGSYRYHKKIEDVSKAISSLGGKYPPALVGLCEVENDAVLKHLTLESSLAKHKYKYIISKSKDARGSNVALLYQRDQLRVVQKQSYTPIIDEENNRTTRDILHIVAEVVNGDILDLFICHYPSRTEGIAKSRPLRIAVSKLLKQKIDSIRRTRKNSHIIIMGDFNDYPFDISIKEILGAKSLDDKIEDYDIYNMFLHLGRKKKELASYKHKGTWNYLDQFIVSANLLNSTRSTHIIDNEAHVFAPHFLVEEDEKDEGIKPFRTYSGWTYLGGTSDHLPIYMDLYIKE